MKINLQKGTDIKSVPSGFSWRYFFFSGILTIIRGMWLETIIWFLTLGFAGIFYVFKINQIYIKKLVRKGYEPMDEDSKNFVKSRKNQAVDMFKKANLKRIRLIIYLGYILSAIAYLIIQIDHINQEEFGAIPIAIWLMLSVCLYPIKSLKVAVWMATFPFRYALDCVRDVLDIKDEWKKSTTKKETDNG